MASKRPRSEPEVAAPGSPRGTKKTRTDPPAPSAPSNSPASRGILGSLRDAFLNKIQLPIARRVLIPRLARKALMPHDKKTAKGKPVEVVRTIRSSRLKREAKVLRDAYGVPHIYAGCEEDLFFLQGVVHAEDRMLQLEMISRLVSGRLSEFAGEKTLMADKFARTMGWKRLGNSHEKKLAEDARKSHNPEAKSILNNLRKYAEGINSVASELQSKKQLPFEFTILGIEPSHWEASDVLGVLHLVCFKMSFGFQTTVLRQFLMETLGREAFEQWFVDASPDCIPTVGENRKRGGSQLPPLSRSALLSVLLPEDLAGMPRTGQGSNCWSLAGDITSKGTGPLLANDPHLDTSIPSFFYESHLHCAGKPGLHMAGMTTPGFPGLALPGHNEHCAWGVTLAMGDAEDVFVEMFQGKMDPELGFPTTYIHRGRTLQVEKHRHVIKVKGINTPVKYASASTHHGPVISKIGGKLQDGMNTVMDKVKRMKEQQLTYKGTRYELSYAACHLSPDLLQNVFLFRSLASATSCKDALKSWSKVVSPSLNICLADNKNKTGNIGYQMSGRIPKRKTPRGSELYPLCGWTGDADWDGYITGTDLPHTLNPPSGKIVSANHKVVDYRHYPHYLGNIWQDGYRANTIEKFLAKKMAKAKGVDMDDCEEIQGCVHSDAGLQFVSHFKDISFPDKDVKDAISIMKNWNGKLTADSVGGCIYKVIFHFYIYYLFESVMGLSKLDGEKKAIVRESMIGHGFNVVLKAFNEFKGTFFSKVLHSVASDNHDKAELLSRCARNGVSWLLKKLGRDMSQWQWGKIHKMRLDHSLSAALNMPELSCEFPFEGDNTTPMQATYNYSMGDDCEPSFCVDKGTGCTSACRVVMCPLHWDQSRSMVTGGQSCKWLSQHYLNQVELFRSYKSKPMLWTRDKVEAAATHKYIYKPS